MAEIQEIQHRGQTNFETLYVTYLQEKLDKIDDVIDMIYDTHVALQRVFTHAEMWQQNIGEDATVDIVKCPSARIKKSVQKK